MPILGGNKQHDWVRQEIESEDRDKTHKGYSHSDDIAGQIKTQNKCDLDESYYKRNLKKEQKGSSFLKAFMDFLV